MQADSQFGPWLGCRDLGRRLLAMIDGQLRDEVDRQETGRKQIAQLAAGDSLALPPEVVAYLDRLREPGTSERIVAGSARRHYG